MCSAYKLSTSNKQIIEDLGQVVQNFFNDSSWDRSITFGSIEVPVLQDTDKGLSIIPGAWPVGWFMPNTRLSGLKVEKKTGELQIERVYEKRLWSEGFEDHHCVIPMSSFEESAYWGPEKGNAVIFQSEDDEILYCAGIKFITPDGKNPNWDAFSLLTDVPGKQMINYHRRELRFLPKESVSEWNSLSSAPSRESFDFLMDNQYRPKFKVSVDRKLKTFSEKKAEEHAEKLAEEIKFMDFLKSEGLRG